VRPEDFFALWIAAYRLQLSTMETATVWWWAAQRELWLPREVARRRPGPSLAEMIRETRQDTFESDEGGAR
jgi:hypothetical protein